MSQTVMITGASGEIGRTLIAGLARRHRRLVSLDRTPIKTTELARQFIQADLLDTPALANALRGVECVVHLAGVPRENDWQPILESNVLGCVNLFEAARANNVKRIVYASSNHVVGFHDATEILTESSELRPDSRYGVSKVFGEALARLYSDKYDISCLCLRIGSFRQRPRSVRELSTWISPRDTVQLVNRSIDAKSSLRHAVFYGVSKNTRCKWFDESSTLIGYEPEDNAEDFAAEVLDQREQVGAGSRYHGGPTTELP